MLRRLKTRFPFRPGRPDKSPRRPNSGRREKPLPPAGGGSPWSAYLTETVRYHH